MLKRLKFLKNEDTWTLLEAEQAGWAIEVVTRLLKCYAPGVRQIKIFRVPIPPIPPLVDSIQREDCVYWDESDCVHWDEFEDGPFEADHQGLSLEDMRSPPALWDSDDEDSLHRLLFRSNLVRLKEEMAIYQAIVGMIQEITWLNHLRVTGFDGDYQTRRKVEDLQTLVKNRL